MNKINWDNIVLYICITFIVTTCIYKGTEVEKHAISYKVERLNETN